MSDHRGDDVGDDVGDGVGDEIERARRALHDRPDRLDRERVWQDVRRRAAPGSLADGQVVPVAARDIGGDARDRPGSRLRPALAGVAAATILVAGVGWVVSRDPFGGAAPSPATPVATQSDPQESGTAESAGPEPTPTSEAGSAGSRFLEQVHERLAADAAATQTVLITSTPATSSSSERIVLRSLDGQSRRIVLGDIERELVTDGETVQETVVDHSSGVWWRTTTPLGDATTPETWEDQAWDDIELALEAVIETHGDPLQVAATALSAEAEAVEMTQEIRNRQELWLLSIPEIPLGPVTLGDGRTTFDLSYRDAVLTVSAETLRPSSFAATLVATSTGSGIEQRELSVQADFSYLDGEDDRSESLVEIVIPPEYREVTTPES